MHEALYEPLVLCMPDVMNPHIIPAEYFGSIVRGSVINHKCLPVLVSLRDEAIQAVREIFRAIICSDRNMYSHQFAIGPGTVQFASASRRCGSTRPRVEPMAMPRAFVSSESCRPSYLRFPDRFALTLAELLRFLRSTQPAHEE